MLKFIASFKCFFICNLLLYISFGAFLIATFQKEHSLIISLLIMLFSLSLIPTERKTGRDLNKYIFFICISYLVFVYIFGFLIYGRNINEYNIIIDFFHWLCLAYIPYLKVKKHIGDEYKH